MVICFSRNLDIVAGLKKWFMSVSALKETRNPRRFSSMFIGVIGNISVSMVRRSSMVLLVVFPS